MTHNSINKITLDDAIALRSKQVLDNINSTISEILKNNSFQLKNPEAQGPFSLHLNTLENRLSISIHNDNSNHPIHTVTLPFITFRRIVKDYIIVCESYHTAINNAYDSAKIETIDMGRRGLHNEGADLVKESIIESIEIDYETCRRLFTIIYLLNLRN